MHCNAMCTWCNLSRWSCSCQVIVRDIDHILKEHIEYMIPFDLYSLHFIQFSPCFVARRVHSLCVLFAKFDIDLNFVTIFTLFPFCCSPGVTPTEAFIWSVSHLSTLLSLQLHLHSASDVTHSWMQLHIMWKCNALVLAWGADGAATEPMSALVTVAIPVTVNVAKHDMTCPSSLCVCFFCLLTP